MNKEPNYGLAPGSRPPYIGEIGVQERSPKMQYRAAVKSISEHVHTEALLAALDKSLKAGAPPSRRHIVLPAPSEWQGLGVAAAAPSDFWFRTVGCLKQPAAPPLDR